MTVFCNMASKHHLTRAGVRGFSGPDGYPGLHCDEMVITLMLVINRTGCRGPASYFCNLGSSAGSSAASAKVAWR